MRIHGLLLAAGAGRRMGTPKALVDDWLSRGVTALRDGGCDEVTVVLGAAAAQARSLLEGVEVGIVEADDWADGMGASLRAGLAALAGLDALPDAALVTLVDLPDVGADVVRRVLAAPQTSPGSEPAGGESRTQSITLGVLRRASYAGVPGHPVLIGRDHWSGVRASAEGDRGARAYLAAREVELVECGDLATGQDVDSPTRDQRRAE
ncbi:NTP transferase domain-containing protein [Nocardioides sp. Root151]|uniref:nucleotidyltransferase family protein n=1 Tax=Nocardioides sp. Root151 TaxID=1736475 RepID=UPI000703395B|nr:nucleotidyltransferase family protein [Nocardioides sp. Root151]KQZ75460.1 molybdopterin-guanine dinucleotide biosynthesis protein MobA [Nocardioides sp. Root151]